MSQTEREAIEAGTVWWDGELFSGRPQWRKLLDAPKPTLRPDEQHFLDHETEELCAMVSDWQTTNIYRDLPPAVWQFIKDKGFWGMNIAKEYGGLGFSAYAPFASHDQAVDAFRHGLGDGDGSEFARARRVARALRHRRAEAPLSAAPREGTGNSLLRAH